MGTDLGTRKKQTRSSDLHLAWNDREQDPTLFFCKEHNQIPPPLHAAMAKPNFLGFLLAKWQTPILPPPTSFAGRTVLITGSNTGLGLAAARHYLALGASHIIMGVRSLTKGEAARAQLETETKVVGQEQKGGVISVLQLDMSDFASIQRFVQRVEREFDRLDVAVLNAGLLNKVYKASPGEEGWEETIQVNALGTVLLAALLLPFMKRTRAMMELDPADAPQQLPHLVLVTSEFHGFVDRAMLPDRVDGGDIIAQLSARSKDAFDGRMQYSLSKFLLMCALEPLARLSGWGGENAINGSEPDVVVISCCPGLCKSDLTRSFDEWYIRYSEALIGGLISRTTEDGARVLVSAATVGKEGNGGYWKNDTLME